MTPEQHAVYLATYTRALDAHLMRSASMNAAVQEASLLAKAAVDLYPKSAEPSAKPAGDEPVKRGPGRPPKEKAE